MNTGNDGSSRLVAALEQLRVHDHLCLVYENRDQQFGAVIPFMRVGLQRGERCVYIADDNTAADVIEAMRTSGIDVESATSSGALAVITKKEAYLKKGYFDPDLMIRFLKEAVDDAKARGYRALRATGEMTWALGHEIGVERLMEYEAKLNYFFPEHDIVAICQYSRTRFSPEIIADMIRTHPLVIHGDMVCRNMYYEPPDEFLAPGKAVRDVERLLNNIRSRESVETALRTREAQLREAQRIGRLGSWDWDADHDTIAWSDEYYRIYGFDPAKSPPRYEEHLKAYTPESAARLDAAVKKSLQTGEPYELDLELADPDAQTRWVSARGEVKRDAGGRIVGLRGTAQDITTLKTTEIELRAALEALEKTRSLLMTAQEIAHLGGFEYVPTTGAITWSEEQYRLHGLNPADPCLTVDQILRKCIHPEDADFIHETFMKAVQNNTAYKLDHRVIWPDGSEHWLHNLAYPYFDKSSKVIKYVGATLDITERKRAEEALRSASAYNRTLIESSLDPLVTIGPDGKITDVNSSTEDVTGYTRGQLLGTDFSDYFTDPKQARAGYQRVFRDGSVRDYALEIRHRNGHVIPVLYNASVYRDETGKVVGVFAAARDITAIKKAEKDLRSAYNKLETSLEENQVLLREVQHRVKNNLQTMISLFKLQATWTEDRRIIEMLTESQNRIRAMALVHEKLSQTKDFAHIQYGSYIGDLASALLSAYAATTRDIALELDIDDVSLGLDTAMHLGLIINELITNSLKHAFPRGRNGVIRIMLRRPAHGEDLHELVVKDNGIGMPGSVDLREARTMGLYLVTNLAETQLKGRIELIRDHGTEFRIRFKGV
jgi:PAS domain S-box-containing protein